MSEERMFPLQPYGYPGPLKIPWIVAEKAWSRYVKLYGATQTLEVMARRAGFSWGEMDTLYPEWRAETDAVTAITAELAKLRARVAELEREVERGRETLESLRAPLGSCAEYMSYGIGGAHTIGELCKAVRAALAPRAEVKP